MSKISLTCDYCKENEAIGVYASDHGPFSLAECEECLKHRNLRTKGNALSKWGRFGDKAFDEYKDLHGNEPMVYHDGNYIMLREYVKTLTKDDINEMLPSNEFPWWKKLLMEKIGQ